MMVLPHIGEKPSLNVKNHHDATLLSPMAQAVIMLTPPVPSVMTNLASWNFSVFTPGLSCHFGHSDLLWIWARITKFAPRYSLSWYWKWRSDLQGHVVISTQETAFNVTLFTDLGRLRGVTHPNVLLFVILFTEHLLVRSLVFLSEREWYEWVIESAHMHPHRKWLDGHSVWWDTLHCLSFWFKHKDFQWLDHPILQLSWRPHGFHVAKVFVGKHSASRHFSLISFKFYMQIF